MLAASRQSRRPARAQSKRPAYTLRNISSLAFECHWTNSFAKSHLNVETIQRSWQKAQKEWLNALNIVEVCRK